MKLLKELSELACDRQTWARVALSAMPTLLSFFFKVQGNPDALYVGLYISFFLFVVFISLYVLWVKNTTPGIPTIDNPNPAELLIDKYPTLKAYAAGSLSILFLVTFLLIFVPPLNKVPVRFIFGTPTSTPTVTPTSTPTYTPTFTATPSATPTTVSDTIYYMIVLDASEKMNESFYGKTKWEVAIESIEGIVDGLDPNAHYGLVVVGGANASPNENPCKEPSVVKMSYSSQDIVSDQISQLRPAGGGSLSKAFNLAKNQFIGLPPDSIKTLIYITGSSDACARRDEWKELGKLFEIPGAIDVDLYSEIIILDEDMGLDIQTIAEHINSLSENINAQAPQSIQALQLSNTTVINNTTNYVNNEIANRPTNTPNVTPTFTSSPKLDSPPPEPIVPVVVQPTSTFTPTFTPTMTFTPPPTPTATPSVVLLLESYDRSGAPCNANITVQVSGSAVTGHFHVWNASYADPSGDYYEDEPYFQVGDNIYLIGLGGYEPAYYVHEAWFEYNGTQSNRLTNLICPGVSPPTP